MSKQFFDGVDWELLRKQKRYLLECSIDKRIPADARGMIAGVVYLIDSLQDEAVEAGYYSEVQVFGDGEAGEK